MSVGESLRSRRAEIRERLIDVARRRDVISYSDLFSPFGVDMDDAAHRGEVSRLLGEIGREEHDAGRPILTVVVVQKKDNQPGEGLYELANELGHEVGKSEDARIRFFSGQLRRTHAWWAENAGE